MKLTKDDVLAYLDRDWSVFERTPRGVTLTKMAEARGVPVALLPALVAQPAELARTRPEALRDLAADVRVAPSIRNEARRALATRP